MHIRVLTHMCMCIRICVRMCMCIVRVHVLMLVRSLVVNVHEHVRADGLLDFVFHRLVHAHVCVHVYSCFTFICLSMICGVFEHALACTYLLQLLLLLVSILSHQILSL